MTSLKTSIKTITYLSDIGCLEIQGASLAGELGDKTLLPVLDTMLYKFDDNEIITSAIDKLKRS
ncbi:hypothetical protein DK796_24950 [Escherichia coli]|nr:hypothetical protein [Escherichia coli]